MSRELFLVTGATGFLALHIIKNLIGQGHRVRGTVRNLADVAKVAAVKKLDLNGNQLELVQADLMDKSSWQKAVIGCTRVLHVASPLPVAEPKHEDELIKPAVEGALNVLEACHAEKNVKRVVLTSSGLAVYGTTREDRLYNELDWPDPNGMSFVYAKSKVLAEKAAWDFVEKKKADGEKVFEFSVINPTFILGPTLHGKSPLCTSEVRFLNFLLGRYPRVPDVLYSTCDVRDVAKAHIQAAFVPGAAGCRHIIVSRRGFISMKEWEEIANSEFKDVKFVSDTDSEVPFVDIVKIYKEGDGANTTTDDSRMRHILEIDPIDFKVTIVDMIKSLIENGRVRTVPK